MILQKKLKLRRRAKCDCCKRANTEIVTQNDIIDDNNLLIGTFNLCLACTKQFNTDALGKEFENETILKDFF